MENFQHSLSDHLSVMGSANSKSRLIILILPAMGAPTRLYKQLYEGILQAGFGIAIMNLRGEGLLNKKQLISDGNFGYIELLKDIFCDSVFWHNFEAHGMVSREKTWIWGEPAPKHHD